MNNITLRGGTAPARAYFPELLADTIAGKLNASTVLDLTVDLNSVSKGYAAMDSREAITRHGTTLKNSDLPNLKKDRLSTLLFPSTFT